MPPSMAEVSKVAGPKIFLGRSDEPPLEVLPISFQSPSAQNAKLPLTTPENEGRDCFGTEGDEDSLLSMSCPYTRSDSIGRSEPSPGARLYCILMLGLTDMFFLRAEIVPVVI